MENLRVVSIYLIAAMIVIFAACEESFMATIPSGLNKKVVRGGHEGPGGFTDHPSGDRYPYPEIVHKVYIPPYDFFSHTKCLAWKITWPTYAGSADINKIPSAFATKTGALNSFYYLNNVHPQNTYNTRFSIFYNSKLISSNGLWNELDHSFNAPEGSMELVWFAKVDMAVNDIQYMVEERPSNFEEHWPGADGEEVEYEEGDFFIYELTDQKLYGGVRIVSMNPRVIEVYLAVPND